jgi:hypothetical protein
MSHHRLRMKAVMVLCACVALAACKDDEPSAGKGGAGSGGGSDAAVPSCVSSVEVDPADDGVTKIDYLCDAEPSDKYADSDNACRNALDCELIDSDMVRELARTCGLASRGMESDCDAFREFNRDCVIMETKLKIKAPGLSSACADCYADTVVCGLQFCLSECAASADDPQCVACQVKHGCRVPFERCSGLDRK